ncbi:MAG: hypothetical protein H0T71_01725 [Acidobacteria bacterium]|nr:hypothetical protein [Acidobacteriota bacterium]
MTALIRELESGAARLRGTTLDGTIRLAEPALNQLLASATSAGLTLAVLPGNRLAARLGMLHATVMLPPISDLSRSPELTFSLASIAIAWALKQVLKQPFIHIHGRSVTIDLAEVPALRGHHHLLRFIRRVELSTEPGVVAAHFHVAVA